MYEQRKRNDAADESPLSGLNNVDVAINKQSDSILLTYMFVKDAQVNDDSRTAAKASVELAKQFKDFNTKSYAQKDQEGFLNITKEASKHAQQIFRNAIVIQRQHFDMLSKNMIALTGTNKKLYQVYCPMYNNDKGAQWLSDSKEIKNPYYGSEMKTCGEVQKEIN